MRDAKNSEISPGIDPCQSIRSDSSRRRRGSDDSPSRATRNRRLGQEQHPRPVDLAARASAAGDEEHTDPTCREQSRDDLPHQTPDPVPSITVLDLSTMTLGPLNRLVVERQVAPWTKPGSGLAHPAGKRSRSSIASSHLSGEPAPCGERYRCEWAHPRDTSVPGGNNRGRNGQVRPATRGAESRGRASRRGPRQLDALRSWRSVVRQCLAASGPLQLHTWCFRAAGVRQPPPNGDDLRRSVFRNGSPPQPWALRSVGSDSSLRIRERGSSR